MKRLLSRLFRRRPVAVSVSTFKVKKTDADKAFESKTAMLAKELGRPNPLVRQ